MNKFQSTALRSALLIAGLGVIAMPIMASAKNSVKKVTGSATATAVSSTASASTTFAMNFTEGFSASISQSDLQQNAFTFSNADGLAYSVEVRFTNFVDNSVWFTGPILVSNDSSLVNKWMVAKVIDHGQSNGNPDSVSIRIVTSPASALNMVVNQNRYLYDVYEVTSGNLRVH